MSKVKRTKSTSAGTARWDAGLVAEPLADEDWDLFVAFLIPENPSEVVHLAALTECVSTKRRKRFVAISREDLIKSVKDEGKSTAGGGKKGKGAATAPPFSEVCEHIRQALASPAGLTPDLDARLIKYYLLKKKREHLTKKEAERKAKDESSAPKSGRESSKGTKSVAAKGAKGSPKKGVAEAKESDVPMPTKAESKMKKRGEGEDLFTSIDDEPEDGPDTYFIFHGFIHAAVFSQIAEIGIPINAIVKVKSPYGPASSPLNENEECEADTDDWNALTEALKMFWQEIKRAAKDCPFGHVFRDIAWVELLSAAQTVPDKPEEKADLAESLFDLLADCIYKLLDKHKQYKLYLQTLVVINLSSQSSMTDGHDLSVMNENELMHDAKDVDTRLYSHQMDALPIDSVTVPLMMNSVLEQVVAIADNGCSDDVKLSQDHNSLPTILDSSIMKLALPNEEKRQLLNDKEQMCFSKKQKGTKILRHHDTSTLKTRHLEELIDIDAFSIDSRMLQLLPYYHLRDFSLFDAEQNKRYKASRVARAHELRHIMSAYGVEGTLLDRALKQFIFESMPLKGTGIVPSSLFKSTLNTCLLWDDPYPVSVLPVTDIEELETVHLENLQLRQLDEWCYHEYLEPSVMLQVLHEAHSKRLHIDSYYHKAGNSLLLAIHNPCDGQENHFTWSNWIHSQVGFSNYLQYVSSVVGPTVDAAWASAEAEAEKKTKVEAERRKREEAEAQNRLQEEEQEDKKKPKEKKGGESPDDSAQCKASRSSKEARSGSQSTASSRASTRKGKEKDKPTSGSKMRTSVAMSTHIDTQVTNQASAKPEIPKLFLSYPIGDRVVRVNGSMSHMFPADGALITVKCQAFIDGYKNQVVAVEKDNCIVMMHVRQGPGDNNALDDAKENEGQRNDAFEEAVKCSEKQLQQQSPKFLSCVIHYDDGFLASISKLGPEGHLPKRELVQVSNQLESKLSEDIGSKPPTPPQQVRSPSVQKVGKKKDAAAEQALIEQQKLQEEEAERQRQAEIERKKQEELDLALRPTYQQLFVSSPDGLHLHYCSVHEGKLEDFNEKSHLEGGRVVVRQSYPTKSWNTQLCQNTQLKTAMEEISRSITADGVVIRFLQNGSTVVLYPDGAVSVSYADAVAGILPTSPTEVQEEHERASSAVRRVKFGDFEHTVQETTGKHDRKDGWMSTSAVGECRLHSNAKEVMLSRGDGVSVVHKPDSSCVVNHADGTRITTFYEMKDSPSTLSCVPTKGALCKFVRIECPGFSAVTFNCQTQECQTSFGEGTQVSCTNRGEYHIKRPDGSILDIAYDGEVCYIPKGAGHQVPGCEDVVLEGAYVFSPTANETLKTIDCNGSKFTVMQNGETDIQSTRNITGQGGQVPRLFVLNQDSSAVELLRHCDVVEFLEAAEANQKAMVVRERLEEIPDAKVITVLKPTPQTIAEKWSRDYAEDGIIPRGLRDRNFSDLSDRPEGQGLKSSDSIPLHRLGTKTGVEFTQSSALEYRQLIEYQPLSTEERCSVMEGFCLFLRWREQQYQRAAALLLADQRSKAEKVAAVELETELLPQDKTMLQDTVLGVAQNAYHSRSEEELTQHYEVAVNTIDETVAECSPSEVDRKFSAKMEQHQQDIDNVKAMTRSLRERNVPNYFNMVEGKRFLEEVLKEGPNMNILVSQLPENQDHSQRIIQRDGSVSEMELVGVQSSHSIASDSAIDPGLGAVSHSPEKATPSPIAEESPADVLSSLALSPVRPLNPTPAQAFGAVVLNGRSPCSQTSLHALGNTDDLLIKQTPELAADVIEQDTPTRWNQTYSEPGDLSHRGSASFSKHRQSTGGAEQLPAISNRVAYVDVTGQLRKQKVKKPLSLRGAKPGAVTNEQFVATENSVRRKVSTSSVAGFSKKGIGPVSCLRGFELLPREVNFGVLREGYTYSHLLVIRNVGIDTCRFKLKQPPPSTGLKVLYSPCPVAAGMSTKLNIEISAVAVGAVGNDRFGYVQHDLEITSETSIFHLPIKAVVITASVYDSLSSDEKTRNSPHPQVKLVSTKPLSREPLIHTFRPHIALGGQ
ncbi:sperm-associated antigen 17-like isoform X2 [Corticium candelabrum]|uniref:sperm-associated antigen 17-like isoform X2 n=1 Tax=Corticium candelabrum TaxID=121492 RepID=UPI002E273389|nr:sperm-associated antigen 17-like isoform X2 [Corticium candelabrum]